MRNERVKTLPAKELDYFLSAEIFYEQTRRKHGQESKPATISNFLPRIVQNYRQRRPEVRFNRKQTSITRVPYNKLLTNLASSSRTGEYWPSVVLYGPRCARSVLSRPRANIPRYGPRARLVRG